jgi:hypothetical protein
MSKAEYTLEELEEIFTAHAKNVEIDNQKSKEKYLEFFPNSELPDYFKNEFNLATALLSIVKIIKEKL